MKILIIGAVAAGTSAAAKARRNDEEAEIKIFEMDSHISYSGCGLPYFIGGEVKELDLLVPRDAAFFKKKYNVDILTRHQVQKIDSNHKCLTVKNLNTQETFVESYDKLIIATGAESILPPIEGLQNPNVFTLRNVKNALAIKGYIEKYNPQKALVIGSGFIGLEMVENLKNMGMQVTIVEMEDHLMKPLDNDVSMYLQEALIKQGVSVFLKERVVRFEGEGLVQRAVLQSGKEIETELVIISTGIRPRTALAKEAGIEVGRSGAMTVNTKMETNLQDIYACGDCAEGFSVITQKPIYRPLGSTANKMGRIAGDQATGGDLEFRGILGTGIFKIFDWAIAQTGLTERDAIEEGYDVVVCHNIKPDKPEYFGGEEMMIKAIADRKTGKLLGAQIVGKTGVDKRIDVFVTAITFGAKVQDLMHLDLAYAPPFSTTKDPVIYTGMILTNELERGRKLITPKELQVRMQNNEDIVIVDARAEKQYHDAHVEGAISIPHEDVRKAIDNLDKEKMTVTYCNKGVTGNAAQNILINKGFEKVYNLSGGHKNFTKTKDKL